MDGENRGGDDMSAMEGSDVKLSTNLRSNRSDPASCEAFNLLMSMIEDGATDVRTMVVGESLPHCLQTSEGSNITNYKRC